MDKEYYSYNQLIDDMKILANMLRPYDFQMIIPITRGGLVPACHLGYLLNIKYYQALCLSNYNAKEETEMTVICVPEIDERIPREKVLVVDGMVDKGTTLAKVRELLGPDVKIASIHIKPHTKYLPDFYLHRTEKWVEYPWEYGR